MVIKLPLFLFAELWQHKRDTLFKAPRLGQNSYSTNYYHYCCCYYTDYYAIKRGPQTWNLIWMRLGLSEVVRAGFERVLETLAGPFLCLLMLLVVTDPNSVKMTFVGEVTCCLDHMCMFRWNTQGTSLLEQFPSLSWVQTCLHCKVIGRTLQPHTLISTKSSHCSPLSSPPAPQIYPLSYITPSVFLPSISFFCLLSSLPFYFFPSLFFSLLPFDSTKWIIKWNKWIVLTSTAFTNIFLWCLLIKINPGSSGLIH